jgi:hypothetical protein
MLHDAQDHDVPKPVLEEWLVHDDGSATASPGALRVPEEGISDEEHIFYALARCML